MTDALQYINQVSIGLNVLQLAGRQQTLNDADPLSSNFRPGKQPVAPTQWNRSQTAFQMVMPISALPSICNDADPLLRSNFGV